jgi:transglycosylase-like protein
LRVRIGRLVAVPVGLLTVATLAVAIGVAPATATGPEGLGRFMYAVGQVESHGNYEARNPSSGAYGKYQFMPASWRAWARVYLGDADAKPTPRNQDVVAAAKMTALFKSLGQWKRVAYWWLTGSKQLTGWSAYATRYVSKVMRIYDATKSAPTPPPTLKPTKAPRTTPKPTAKPTPELRLVANIVHHYSEGSPTIRYEGSWKLARHPAYAGDAVRYATRAGSRATFAFNAHSVTWYGPVGPTRGQARVFVDGTLVATVDLYARDFTARKALFTRTWSRIGRHTLAIEVAGTAGRPYVAIDEFTVTE